MLFFENINNTFKELKTKYNEIYNGVININGAFETERLVLKPCDESSNNIMREYCKKNLNQFKDLYKIDNFNENKLPVGVGYSSKLKFSIFLKDSNELIGTIDLDDCICEVKYVLKVFIFDKFRGKGYATEASKAIVNKAMKKELYFLDDTIRHYVYEKVPLDIKCIEAVVDENNVAANKVLEKCGFKLTGKNYYAHHYKNAYYRQYLLLFYLSKVFHKKRNTRNLVFLFFGGDNEIRTRDLCVANASLYQLSHTPTGNLQIAL